MRKGGDHVKRVKQSVDEILADTPGRAEREARGRVAGLATAAKRGAQVGSTDQIRDYLRSAGTATARQIADGTGLPYLIVNRVVSHTTGEAGGIVSLGGRKGSTRYALFDSPAGRAWLAQTEKKPPAESEFAIAAGVLTFEFIPLQRDPFEAMRLALLTRST